jgi:hypothetical protein
MNEEAVLTEKLCETLASLTTQLGLRRAAALFPGLSHTSLGKRRKKKFQINTLQKLHRGNEPKVKSLAARLLKVNGCPVEDHNVVPFTLFRGAPFKRRRIPAVTPPNPRAIFMHAALQLETADFPRGDLVSKLLSNSTTNEIHKAAANDLVSMFIDAAYFGALTRALRTRLIDTKLNEVPNHPLRRIEINKFYCEARALKSAMQVTRTLSAIGREASDIFRITSDEPVLANPAHVADVYGYLYNRSRCPEEEVALFDVEVILATAATAAARATLAALSAAATLTEYTWIDSLPADLFELASEIHKLLHYGHVDTFTEAAQMLGLLPDGSGDRSALGQALSLSLYGLVLDKGAWFYPLERAAFISPWGSLLKGADGDENEHEFLDPDTTETLPV